MRNKQQMPNVSRVNNLKRRKGKCAVALTRDLNVEVKNTDKVSPSIDGLMVCAMREQDLDQSRTKKSSVKRMDIKKTKTEDSKIPFSDCMIGGCRESSTTAERLSSDCYEFHEKESYGATPRLEELWEGKENGLRFELGYYRTMGLPEKMEGGETEECDQSIFLDDDSNHVLPVETFFGNMEVVQDCPQRPTATSTLSRREHRRRQYYAKEDSDEESDRDMQQNDIGGTT